ncbi:MAG TPA: sulfatase [Candidatus Binatia bacterium]
MTHPSTLRQRSVAPSSTLVLACVALAFVAACTSSPPQPEAPTYAVVSTLAKPKETLALSVRSRSGEVLGREFRPTAEVAWSRPLTPKGPPSVVDGALERVYEVGPFLVDQTVMVSRTYEKKGEATQSLPAVLATAKGRELVVRFDIPNFDGDAEDWKVHAVAFIIPPPERVTTTEPITVPPGAVLEGAYGLSPASAGASTSPVRLELVALTDAGSHVLLSKELAQDDERSFEWSDYRIDLEELAGQKVRFELRSEVAASDAEQALRVGYPVWSVPVVLAPRAADDTRNVVLISLDTLRADFVGAYGQKRPTTPNLDRLAEEGALFENVYTTYPSTTASHMTMLTGVHPSVHGVYAFGSLLPSSYELLSTVLAARGYQTAAVTEDGMIHAFAGFVRGFRSYREYLVANMDEYGVAAEVIDSGIEWLRRHKDERFFLFLHTYQVHSPYAPPEGYDVFEADGDGADELGGPFPPDIVRTRLAYAGDVLYTDAQVARLLAELDALGRRDDTVVIVTADHGEALGENGLLGHNWFATEPVLRIPLLIRAPGRVPAGARVSSLVSLVDLAPTVLDLAGVSQLEDPMPEEQRKMQSQMQGTNLVRLLDGAELAERAVYVEHDRQDGRKEVIVRQGTTKWIATDGRVLVRYDLESDPLERERREDPELLAPGQKLVDAYVAANDELRRQRGNPRPTAVETDDATMKKLRALGYVE